MSGFVYYLPAGGSEALEAAGLTDRFALRPAVSLVGAGGPGPEGQLGTIFHAGTKLPPQLKWQAAPGQPPPYWVGFDPLHPPRPAELERGRQILGTRLVLGDHQAWTVPLLWGAPGRPEHGLPLEPVLVEGHIGLFLPEELGNLRAQGELVLPLLADWPARCLDTFEFCVALLAAGYRIGAAEVLALRLFDSDLQAAMIGAALDVAARLAPPET